MRFGHGTLVWVKDMSDETSSIAIVAGVSNHRSTVQMDSTGRFVITPSGYFYYVRYSPFLGVYNVHESRLVPCLRGPL